MKRCNVHCYLHILSFLTWLDLAILCIVCGSDRIWQDLNDVMYLQICWYNSPEVRTQMYLRRGHTFDWDYVSSRRESNYLLKLYYYIIRSRQMVSSEKQLMKNQYVLFRHLKVDTVYAPLTSVAKDVRIYRIIFNPVHDMLAIVYKDWDSFTLSVCKFGKTVESHILYHYTDFPERTTSVDISWSPKGSFLLCILSFGTKGPGLVKLFQYMLSIDKIKQLHYKFPAVAPWFQTKHAWINDSKVMLVHSTKVADDQVTIHLYTLPYRSTKLICKVVYLNHPGLWERVGFFVVAHSNLFFLERCPMQRHEGHHFIIQHTIKDDQFVFYKKYIVPGYVVDMCADSVDQLILVYRISDVYQFDGGNRNLTVFKPNELPSNLVCSLKQPWIVKKHRKTYDVYFVTINCNNGVFDIFNLHPDLHLESINCELTNHGDKFRREFAHLITHPSIVCVTRDIVVFNSAMAWRMNIIVFRHHEITFTFHTYAHDLYLQHCKKPFCIVKNVFDCNSKFIIRLLPYADSYFKHEYYECKKRKNRKLTLEEEK